MYLNWIVVDWMETNGSMIPSQTCFFVPTYRILCQKHNAIQSTYLANSWTMACIKDLDLLDLSNTHHDLAEEEQPFSFREVQDWSDNIDDGMFNLQDIFVPINVNNEHWLLLQVDFREKGIRLYDSMRSVNPKNRKYLSSIQKYIYDSIQGHPCQQYTGLQRMETRLDGRRQETIFTQATKRRCLRGIPTFLSTYSPREIKS